MSTSISNHSARRLLQLWDEQQAAYVADREQRFAAMLDVLSLLFPDELTVLDLACGPGAIADRVLTALPRARVVAVDYDPILLHVARGVLADHGDRADVREVDLVAPDWPRVLDGQRVDAVLSSTALHWLSPEQLLRVYRATAELLPPGGILLNADHLRFAPSTTLHTLAQRHETRVREAGFANGALTYQQWYDEALTDPEIAALAPERERRFADRPPQPLAPLEFHLAALRTAGFSEVGTAWQLLDDYVVFARR
ncbi:class I SAM-dependent methyltransferase [Micromonospora sp. NPDC050397]|uniref:class I SAM-dependent methyltransferase n=1 Tax=Micromonospora sp. NPDC050397 TaxID=3364279 RepID=UPI00384E2CB9